MRLVHDDNQVDVIPKYRGVTKESLMPYISSEQIVYFPFESISSNYLLDAGLYNPDLLHLSPKGNEKLALELSKVIKEWVIDQGT